MRARCIARILFLIFAVCASGCAQNRNLELKGCNIIVIGIDTLRADHIGFYGYQRNTTPGIDDFARKSFVFTNAVSQSSWTLPSFMSMFTSEYPSRHGVTNKYTSFADEGAVIANLSKSCPGCVTLAELLQQNGYATVAFTGDAGVGSEFGFSKGFDYYYENKTFGGLEDSFSKATEWLTLNKDKKFFLFLHGYDAHGSFDANATKTFYSTDYHGSYKGTKDEYLRLRNLTIYGMEFNMSSEDIEFWNDWYDNKVLAADKKFASFVRELESLDLLNNTIIVVTSDHGNEIYEHKGFDHGHTLYDELIHVPFIVHLPNQNGLKIDQQVRLIDIMPTVIGLVGINLNEKVRSKMQGTSLVPAIHGKNLKLNAFSETDYLLLSYKRSLRTYDGWKFIYTLNSDQKELYNLNTDPKERINLINKEPKKAEELEKELYKWMMYR